MSLSAIRRILSIIEMSTGSVRTSKKIIVIESDDWGSIRTPRENFQYKFNKIGLNFSRNPYLQFDTLEDNSDIDHLLNIFDEIWNETGRKPKITLNYVMANPDFQKIRESEYQQYYYEKFPDTYKKLNGDDKTFELVKEGIHQGLFLPQFHGREHLNVPFWLDQLNQGNKIYLEAFESSFWGIGPDVYSGAERNIQAAFDLRSDLDLPFAAQSINEGINLFKEIFGFPTKSIIPNNYIWSNALNEILIHHGVKYMQGMKLQKYPKFTKKEKRQSIKRKSGKVDEWGILQLVRNTSLEPSFSNNREKVFEDCLRDIKTAFLFKQPAVISMHRINFVGGINEHNRLLNLTILKKFFVEITKKWPDVEFWNSVELGDYLSKINQENESFKSNL